MTGGGIGALFKVNELKKRVFTTLLFLIIYRIGVQVPTPGIDSIALMSFFAKAKDGLLGLFNMFSGGALEQLSVFALGIMPYISASIILQLLTVTIPHLERLSKEGEQGRKKITQYTRYGTIILSVVQGFAISIGLESMTSPGGAPIVVTPGWMFRLMTVITLTAGTAFIMWIGEQISERGIGNGISLIIFVGIVVRMPSAIGNTFSLISTGEIGILPLLFLVVLMVFVLALIVFIEQGQRRIQVQYAKRIVGRRMYSGQSTHLPLKINVSGVIPPIFASAIIMFPATIVSFIDIPWIQNIANTLRPTNLVYEFLFIVFIFFFCYFYTAVTFNPTDVAENMKKQGGYIPGIRPGKNTTAYIDKILTRLTLIGALYVSVICVLPSFLTAKFSVPFYFGGTALLIVVSVAIDVVTQLESYVLTRHYEGFLKKSNTKLK